MVAEPEPQLVRWSVAVSSDAAELAVYELLEAFPGGMEEERVDAGVLLHGYLVAGISPDIPAGYVARSEPVDPGWREAWRTFHRPVRIGPFWVGPPWLDPDPGSDPIVIEPALAFGTGAHGSTRGAAEVLRRTPVGGAIGDVGCGSGVLSIIAGRLGWGPIEATDIDRNAVVATTENAALNGVDVRAWHADALIDPLPTGEVLIANLQLEILEPLFCRVDLPATVIVSGLLERERFRPAGWRVDDEELCDGWRSLRLVRG